jgi:DNA polymerase-4
VAAGDRIPAGETPAWSSPILHADLDAFYASVETLNNPRLRGAPVIVGGLGSRGVVTSASYEARRYGVRAAMPVARARRLCPAGVFVQPNFPAYIERSHRVKEVFDSFSTVVEPLSLDEAFLDVRRAHRIWPNPPTIAEALKDRVLTETGLILSVGVAPNKFLAKLASRLAKPDGVVVVDPRKVTEFLAPLEVGCLWGVGEQTATVLGRLGLRTIGDVAAASPAYLERVLGAHGAHLSALAAGRDDGEVVANLEAKSVGAEETYGQDLTERAQISAALLKLADRVASRLRSQGTSGQTVSLKVRLGDFTTFSRSRTLKFEIDSATGIYGVAGELLARFLTERPGKSVWLLGISVSNLCRWPASQQLLPTEQPGWGAAELTLDAVRRRFGDDAIGFGALLAAP